MFSDIEYRYFRRACHRATWYTVLRIKYCKRQTKKVKRPILSLAFT